MEEFAPMVVNLILPIVMNGDQGIAGLWAYLDPGSGSLALQVLLAGLMSAGFCLRSWVRHLREAFTTKN
jgi:hypothetical protein